MKLSFYLGYRVYKQVWDSFSIFRGLHLSYYECSNVTYFFYEKCLSNKMRQVEQQQRREKATHCHSSHDIFSLLYTIRFSSSSSRVFLHVQTTFWELDKTPHGPLYSWLVASRNECFLGEIHSWISPPPFQVLGIFLVCGTSIITHHESFETSGDMEYPFTDDVWKSLEMSHLNSKVRILFSNRG